jgi:hypothetical protein
MTDIKLSADTRKKLKKYQEICDKAGVATYFHDYDLTMSASIDKENFLRISYVYRAERDGYTGYKFITEEALKEWIEKVKK